MTSKQKKITIMIAGGLLVIFAILGVVELARVTLMAVVGLLVLGLVVFVFYRVWAKRKTKTIFGFYVAANDILIDDESRYHFEVAEVIRNGEKIVRSMPDAPSLTRFALGALYYSTGNHSGAVEHLALAAEEEVLKESPHALPSRPLRRYVKRMRKIEKRPRLHAKINAAMASLGVMNRERGALMLADSQQQLKGVLEAYENEMTERVRVPRHFPVSTRPSLKSNTGPATISEVLNDIYQEEPKAS